MDQMVPEIVRIGVANARIKCVTPQRVRRDKSALLTSRSALETGSSMSIRGEKMEPAIGTSVWLRSAAS